MSTSLSLSDLIGLVSAAGVVFSVFIATRSLNHTRKKDEDELLADDARAKTVLEEHARKFDRIFDAQAVLNEKLVEHLTDCAKDKSVLAERMLQQATTLERVNNRLDSVARTLGNVSYEAVKDVARKLTE